MRAALIFAVVAVGSFVVRATTLQQLSLNDMIVKSTLVVRGTVQPSYSAAHGSVIYTHYTVHVSEQWKGTTPVAQVDFAVPGGRVNGIQQTFAGAPSFSTGQEYVLFLWTSRSGLTQVIGLSQGLFVVSPGSGDPMVNRPVIGQPMLDANGQPTSDPGMQMQLSVLRSRIQTALGGK